MGCAFCFCYQNYLTSSRMDDCQKTSAIKVLIFFFDGFLSPHHPKTKHSFIVKVWVYTSKLTDSWPLKWTGKWSKRFFIEERSKFSFIFTSTYVYFTVWGSVNRNVCLFCRIVYISVNNLIELWIFSDWNLITLWLNLSAAWLLWSCRQFNNVDNTWMQNVKQWLGQS